MYLSQKAEFKGEWFLPQSDGKRLNGVLTYDPLHGSELEVYGLFSDDCLGRDDKTYDIILGLIENGKEITINGAFLESVNSVGFVDADCGCKFISRFYVNRFFLGCHIKDIEDLKFTSASAHIVNLETWVGKVGFCLDVDQQDNDTIHLSYRDPVKMEFNLPYDDIKGAITFGLKESTVGFKQLEYHLVQNTKITIESSTPQPLMKLRNLSYSFLQFMVLAMFKSTCFDSYELKVQDSSKPILLYFKQELPQFESQKNNRDMLFCFDTISTDFQSIIKKWYTLCDEMKYMMFLFTELFTGGKVFTPSYFLNVAQVSEALYGVIIGNEEKNPSPIPNKEIQKILEVVSKEYVDIVKSRLMKSYPYILLDKMKRFVKMCPCEFTKSFIEDVDTFAKKVTDSRNYYTHFDKGNKQIVEGLELAKLANNLKIIVIYNLLNYLGIENSTIEEKLSNHVV